MRRGVDSYAGWWGYVHWMEQLPLMVLQRDVFIFTSYKVVFEIFSIKSSVARTTLAKV